MRDPASCFVQFPIFRHPVPALADRAPPGFLGAVLPPDNLDPFAHTDRAYNIERLAQAPFGIESQYGISSEYHTFNDITRALVQRKNKRQTIVGLPLEAGKQG